MGSEIKAARKARGMTQAEFAKALGMNRATISKYENGVVEPSVTQLKKMADVLGIQWYLLVPSENKEAYINADTYGLSLAEFKREAMYVKNSGGAHSATLRNKITGELMDVKVHEDGSVEASPTYFKPDIRIMSAFWTLNTKGKEKAADMVEMIAGNPEYQYMVTPDPDDDDEYYEEDGEEEWDTPGADRNNK